MVYVTFTLHDFYRILVGANPVLHAPRVSQRGLAAIPCARGGRCGSTPGSGFTHTAPVSTTDQRYGVFSPSTYSVCSAYEPQLFAVASSRGALMVQSLQVRVW